MKEVKRLCGFLLALFITVVSFSSAYYIEQAVFAGLHIKPFLGGFLLTAILGFVINIFFIKAVMLLFRRHFRKHEYFQSRILSAMGSIARGDFDVFIDPEDASIRGDLASLADSLNQMARSLGTMEQMRQDYISNVSHEMQSPLTSISGFAELLRSEDLSPQQREHYLSIIATESKRLSGMSDKLLKLSVLESGQEALDKKEFRLDRQLENVALMLEMQWSAKNLNVEADLPKTLYIGDQELLSQVWINLLHNAIKYTPAGGSIQISLSAANGEIQCQVADTGVGISAAEQMHIFERFYKVDKARDRSLGGSGLGLSLVKRIVELHGGTVRVDSEPGQGTTFTVALGLTSPD